MEFRKMLMITLYAEQKKRHRFKIISWLLPCMLSCFRHVWFFVTLWTIACQALLYMEFSRQESWSGSPCPPAGESSWPRDWICVSYTSCIGRQVLVHWDYYCHLRSRMSHPPNEIMTNMLLNSYAILFKDTRST